MSAFAKSAGAWAQRRKPGVARPISDISLLAALKRLESTPRLCLRHRLPKPLRDPPGNMLRRGSAHLLRPVLRVEPRRRPRRPEDAVDEGNTLSRGASPKNSTQDEAVSSGGGGVGEAQGKRVREVAADPILSERADRLRPDRKPNRRGARVCT